MNLGEKLKELRTQHDYYQKDIHKKLDIAQNTLSGYERNERTPSLDVLIKLADFYNVSTDYLLGREDKQNEISNKLKLLIQYSKDLPTEDIQVLTEMAKRLKK